MKKKFITGLLILIPLGVTYWVLAFLTNKAQSFSRPWVQGMIGLYEQRSEVQIPEFLVTLVSLALVFFFVLALGALANVYIGKKLLAWLDLLLLRLPVIRSIYGGTKQIIDAFSIQQSSGAFKKVVLIEYPRKDCWAFGFLSSENLKATDQLLGTPMVAVFMPSTPNPTTGFLLYMPPEDIRVIQMSVEDAVKLIVSAGIVLPNAPWRPPQTLATSPKQVDTLPKADQ
jgi:uncharacterized membrane protein